MDSSLTKGKHAGLSADSLAFGTGGARHLLRDLHEVDPAHQVHLARVNLEDVEASVLVGVRELDLSVDTARSQQSIVKDVNSVGRHDNLDLVRCLETIELVEQLKHGSLHLRVTPLTAAHSGATDGVDLVHEDDGRRMLSCHDEEFSHHPGTFTDVLLHELRATDSDELTIGVVSDGSGQQGLAGTRRTIEQDTLGLCDTERVEDLGMLDRQLDDLLDFLYLLLETANHVISGVGNLLDLHESDERVDLGRQYLVDHEGLALAGDTRVGRQQLDINLAIDVDHVLAIAANLDEALLLAHHLGNLADLTGWRMQMVDFFLEVLQHSVHFVTLRSEAAQVVLLLDERQFELLDLRAVVGVQTARLFRLDQGLGTGEDRLSELRL